MKLFGSTNIVLIATVISLMSTSAFAEEFDARDVFQKEPLLQDNKVVLELNPHVDSQFSAPIDLGEIVTDDVFASVGRGFDPIEGKILSSECVVGTEPDHVLPDGATIPRSKIGIVNDVKSYASASASSVGFSAIIKTVQVGFGTSEANGQYFNSVEQFARIYSRIATDGVERRNVKWSKDAGDWIKNDLSKFLKQCGTRYVRGVFKGHLLDMSAHFALQQDKQTSADATAVSIGVPKIFSASMSTSDAEAKVNEHASAVLTSHGVGALSIPPAPSPIAATGAGAAAAAGATTGPAPAEPAPGGAAPAPSPAPAPAPAPAAVTKAGPIETLINYYNNGFIAAVTAAGKKGALPLYIVVDDYQSTNNLPYTNKIPLWTETVMQEVVDRTDMLQELTTDISDLRYAIAGEPVDRVAAFYQGTIDDAKVKLTKAEDYLKKFRVAVLHCKGMLDAGKDRIPDGRTAAEACEKELDDSVPPTEMPNLKLKRKY